MSAGARREKWVSISCDRGEMGGFLALPASRPAAALVVLQEIFGVNEAMRAKARRFADMGYLALVPDLFWRQAPRVELGYSEEDRQRGFAFMQKFDSAAGVRDIAATARWLEAATDSTGRVGVVGFCLGGKLAVAASRAYPFAAIASLYGVRLDADPVALESLEVPFQFHVGDRDAHISATSVEAVREALQGRSNAEVFVYPGAQHGFYNPVRMDVFDPTAALLAQERIGRMLARALGS